MLDLMAEIARQPLFPENEVALAKANALQALRVAETQPVSVSRSVYVDHPYSRTDPPPSLIHAVNAALLRAEHAKRFRPEAAHCWSSPAASPKRTR